ncbi:MAG: glycosyltransferase [Candidatus Micrarchaeia archaeon]
MDYKDITVVLPTLNEKKTIGKLISAILNRYKGINIIVVDDSSTDGTIAVVNGIMSRDKHVRLLERKGKKAGLTAAIIDGIMMCRTRYVIVMDADMQHPYQEIINIKKKFEQGYELVVAVRESVKNWEFYRKLISRSLIYLGYTVLLANGKARCSDIFSGYFGIKRDLFEKVFEANRGRFVMEGYKVLFDTLKCIDHKSVRIGEVPYHFHIREYGESKAGVKVGIALFKSFVT